MAEQTDGIHRPNVWPAVLRNLAALALCLLCYYLAPLRGHFAALSVIGFVLALIALTVLIVREVRRLIDSSGGPAETRLGPLMIAVYLALVVFASTYYRLAEWSNQMSGLETKTDALYFTLVTLSTVGYGDIRPIGQAARIVTMTQIAFNLVVIASAVSVVSGQLRMRAARRHGGAT